MSLYTAFVSGKLTIEQSNSRLIMKQYNNFWIGFLPGLLAPIVFMWLYVERFFPGSSNLFEIVGHIYPSELLGQMLMLSVMPNLGFVFLFYKSDSFRLAAGIMVAAMPYFIACFFMM
jgi:hypothetical protein